jgi:hypothetical protein
MNRLQIWGGKFENNFFQIASNDKRYISDDAHSWVEQMPKMLLF